jgi:hypothetical protein
MKTIKNHWHGIVSLTMLGVIAFNTSEFWVAVTQHGWKSWLFVICLGAFLLRTSWVYFDRWLDMAMTKAYQEGFENASLDRQHYGEKKYMDGWLDCQKKIKK